MISQGNPEPFFGIRFLFCKFLPCRFCLWVKLSYLSSIAVVSVSAPNAEMTFLKGFYMLSTDGKPHVEGAKVAQIHASTFFDSFSVKWSMWSRSADCRASCGDGRAYLPLMRPSSVGQRKTIFCITS